MARTKQTARRPQTYGMRPVHTWPAHVRARALAAAPKPKPFPKGRHVLETLYSAINEGNVNLAKYVLTSKIYGKENLYNAIVEIFEDLNLARDIFSFVYWKVDKNSLTQNSTNSAIDVDDTFGTGFPLLLHAIKSENPKIARLLIGHVHEIDVNLSVRKSYHENFPFQQALKQKQFGVISALLERDEFDIDNAFKHTIEQNINLEVMSLLVSFVLKGNLDIIQALKLSMRSNKYVEILKMLLQQNFSSETISWLTNRSFGYALENTSLITLQVLVKHTMILGMDLLEMNRVKASKILKTLVNSNKFDQIIYLVEIAGYKITPDVISFAVHKDSCNSTHSSFDHDSDSNIKSLISYLQVNFSKFESHSPKRRKLN